MVKKPAKLKDPKGGLTKAGRDEFHKQTGANLKPGIKKTNDDMSLDEMRRKGSWAVRFYGRAGELPPLKNKNGDPTRFALTAVAWGEAVPRSVAAAREIAAKGRKLLQAYKKLKPK